METQFDPKLCFVLMPMSGDFEDLYKGLIKPTVEECGLECLYAGEIFGARLIMDDIWTHIERARVLIADLTGRNVNVFYEVGYGHAFDRHKVILITRNIDDVPFDLQGFRCIKYQLGPGGLRALREDLKNNVQAVLEEEPHSPRVVTMKVEVPTPPDEETIEAVALLHAVAALEKGDQLPPTKQADRVRRLVTKLGGPITATGRSQRLATEQLERLLDRLSPRHRGVLELRLGLRDGQFRTLDEVGQMFGVTAPRVRELQQEALTEMLRALDRRDAQLGEEEAEAAVRVMAGGMEGMEAVLVPAGSFLMGSNVKDNEKPPSHVSLGDFYIARYPVTNRQYGEFGKATGHPLPAHWYTGVCPEHLEEHPVVWVTWHDAQEYCRWLGAESGRPVRLPTEAEWEKAARGADGRRYPWGDVFYHWKCNSAQSGFGETTRVNRYSPDGDSPYGVSDMAGNVWEWTSTLYEPYPYHGDDGREDPEAEGDRVLRGGAFDNASEEVRSACRIHNSPDQTGAVIGFRVAFSPGSRHEPHVIGET